MNSDTVKINITTTGDTSGVNKVDNSLKGMDENAQKSNGILGDLGGAAKIAFAVVGTAAVAAAVVSVKMATDFQASMEMIQTQAGASSQEVKNMSSAVLDLSGKVATSPEELAQGLYHIESAGFRGKQALDMLAAAAEGARVGNANLEDTTQAMIAITASHIKGVKDQTQAMGVLNAIVGSGDMRMEGLAQAMSSGIVPAAAAFGLSIQDVGAAMATLTDNAIPPTDAATRLRMAISMMGAPTGAAAKAMEKIGLSSTQLSKDMSGKGGLMGTLEDLQTHLKNLSKPEQEQVIARMFGGGRNSSVILTLLGQMDRLKSKYDDINKGTGEFATKWTEYQQTAQYQMQQFSANTQRLGILFGNILLPVFNQVLAFINANLMPAFNSFSDWVNKNQGPMNIFINQLFEGIKKTGQLIGSIFSPVLQNLKNLWNQHHASIVLVAEVIGGALYLAIIGAAAVISTIISVVVILITRLFELGETISRFVSGAIGIVKSGLPVIGGIFKQVFIDIYNNVASQVDLIIGLINMVIGAIDGIMKGVENIVNKVPGMKINLPQINQVGTVHMLSSAGSNIPAGQSNTTNNNSNKNISITNNNSFATPYDPTSFASLQAYQINTR